MTYDTIEEAFLFVSGAPPFEHPAVVRRKTGESFYASLMSDYDELPDDVDASDDYINIPHKNDLDLGKLLVMEFVRSRCPAELARVEALFNRPGAFRHFKDLLRRQRLLDSWQVFEGQRIEALLRQWCQAQGLSR